MLRQNKAGKQPSMFRKTVNAFRIKLFAYLEAPFKYLFGRDIFISYSRADASTYAPNLANTLREKIPALSFYLDRWGAPADVDLPRSLKRSLRWSSVLVIIGTERAVSSPFVQAEIAIYGKTPRQVIPIDVDGALSRVDWNQEPWSRIKGAAWEHERLEGVKGGSPSETVLRRIGDSVTFTRQDQRLQRAVRATVLGVLILITGGVGVSAFIIQKANAQASARIAEAADREKFARENAEKAEKRAAEADIKAGQAEEREKTANEKALTAESKAEASEMMASKAEDLRERAETKAAEAKQLEAIATANAEKQRLIASSRQLATQATNVIEDQQDLSLLLSVAANQTFSTFESRRSLLAGLFHQTNLTALLRGLSMPAVSIALSPDGKTLATGSADGSVVFWDVHNHRQLNCPSGGFWDKDQAPVAFSPDGKLLASGNRDDNIYLWDVETRQKRGEISISGPVTTLAFSPDGRLLSDGEEGEVWFWDVHDVANPKALSSLNIDADAIPYIFAISPDGKMLALTEHTKPTKIVLYDLATLKPYPERLEAHKGVITGLIFNPDPSSKVLASSDSRGMVILWDVVNHKPLTDSDDSQLKEAGTSISFSSDGKILATGREDGTISLWDVDLPHESGGKDTTYKKIRKLLYADVAVYKHGVARVMFIDNDQGLVTANLDSTIAFWDLSDRQPLVKTILESTTLLPKDSRFGSAAFSRDGQYLAIGALTPERPNALAGRGQVVLWRVGSSEPPRVLPPSHTREIEGMEFSPDGNILATFSDDEIVLWDINRNIIMGSHSPEHKRTQVLAFSPKPNSNLLVSNDGDHVILWDIANPQAFRQIVSYPLTDFSCVAFSRNGEMMATGGEGKILLWDMTKLRPIQVLKGFYAYPQSVAFSPDDASLLAVDEYGRIALWNLTDIKASARFFTSYTNFPGIGSRANVQMRSEGATISPDGTLIAIPLAENILLWDVLSHSLLGYIPSSSAYVSSLTFSRDGKKLVLTSGGRVILIDLDPRAWEQRACDMVGRKLTAAEKIQYTDNSIDQLGCSYAVTPIECAASLTNSFEPTAVKVDPKIYDTYAGQYALTGGLWGGETVLNITREGDKLIFQEDIINRLQRALESSGLEGDVIDPKGIAGANKLELLPESEAKYFFKDGDSVTRIIFVKDGLGKVIHLILRSYTGYEFKAKKIK